MHKRVSIHTETAPSQQDAPLCELAERATPGWSADAPNQASSSPYFNRQSVQLSQESQGVDLRHPISHQAPQAEALPPNEGAHAAARVKSLCCRFRKALKDHIDDIMLYFSAPKAKPNQAFLIQGPLQDSNTPSQSTSKVDTCAKVKIKKGRTDTEEWIEAIIDQDQSKIEPTKVNEEGSENAPHTPSTEPKNTSTRNWWRAAADIINSGLDWFLIFVKFIKLTLLLSS